MKSFMSHLLESTNNFNPLDETEAIHLNITDDLLNSSSVIAYGTGQILPDMNKNGKEIPVNPKKFPTKAIHIIIPIQELRIHIFFDTESKQWDSDIIYKQQHVKLSPDQMGQFFNSMFYQKLLNKFQKQWPLSDKMYGDLYAGLQEKEMKIYPTNSLNEDSPDKKMTNKDIDGDNKRDFTSSGRKIIKFTDMNVSSKGAVFYCWPDIKKTNKWSTWKDWTKIHPLCRMRFIYNGIPFGLTISIMKDDNDVKYRGFRGYDLAPDLPPVQWLTREENEQVMKLNIVNKFVKHCVEKLTKYANMPVEEILSAVNDSRLSKEEIEATQLHIRKTIPVIKKHQIDTFKWR